MKFSNEFSETDMPSESELGNLISKVEKIKVESKELDKPIALEIGSSEYSLLKKENMDCPDYASRWSRINKDINEKENLEAVNPNYKKGVKWKINCQRCVPTYEMRMRGYDVTAQSCSHPDFISSFPFCVWENTEILPTVGNGMDTIEKKMSEWGDGSRAQVIVIWDKADSGHTFIAEQRDGKTVFLDPQTADEDVSWYFDNVRDDLTLFCRIDNLEPTSEIASCCKNRRWI